MRPGPAYAIVEQRYGGRCQNIHRETSVACEQLLDRQLNFRAAQQREGSRRPSLRTITIIIAPLEASDIAQFHVSGAHIGNLESSRLVAPCHSYTILTSYFSNVTSLIDINIS